MSRPDLSFLLPPDPEDDRGAASGGEPAGTAGEPAVPSGEGGGHRRQPPHPEGPVAALIAELRAYQAELEVQNKVLRYSQTAAESASERFETLFASVPLALMVLDEHDMVVQANSMAHRWFQPTESDRPLTSLMPFVSAADAARVRATFEQARDHGHGEASEVLFPIGDGDAGITGDLYIARIEAPQADGAPEQWQFLCAVVDQGPLVAERRALQHSATALQERNAQLYASERRLEAVINSALDAIICVDQNQRITVFNPTAAALFQCATADALGSPLDRFLPDAVQALAFAQLATQAVLGEMVALTASGKELAVEVSVSFERHAEGETTTVFARDLTGRKKAEAHRNELEAQLRESHKMQAVGTMAGGIAHDFNNILSAILGNVELAKADCAAGSPVLESLREIEKAGRRARDLVRQILTFSRNEPPRRTAVPVAEAIHDTERLLRVTLPPAIELRLHLDRDLPALLADATQVEQALLNLCTNAIHALGDARGTVCVEASAVQPDHRLCERLALPPGEYVAISVVDNGPGIDAATQLRIFEPFFTTKPVGQGTGLGLAVVHGVMRTHGGAVDVQSAPGEGSRFTLYFPAAEAEAAPAAAAPAGDAAPAAGAAASPAAPASPAAGAPDERQRHVMYVDDDQALVFLVQRLLRRRGYRVTGFTDPREAAVALGADPQAYDLVVTDYNMPGYCGVDLVREAKRIRADLPVALASGHVTAEIERDALAEGASALIHKPNDVDELCATVDRLVHGGPA
ncbi:ATP-binding protein [Acidovorax sp. NCPPB 3859]|nr:MULTISPECIES: ATP-binding protein [unclassified Acidovorax]MDA8450784.1 ATP-binding protein [Acidovorax sp. GBBC 3297]MDA8460131.1 ATP-binding protein [Acidovorax sp. GBBC 3333]MDA8465265.1 ATP-binding protein [Acidovorax sp. GBBC 3332]MDA8470201.1 ATP-binding protein [Acidovorax sp. GBBC 3299]WCM80830.1 ATP-binding protein [Acidovorax sp. GBBC 712]